MRAAPILVGAALVLGVILFLSKRAEASTAPAAWTDNVSSWLDNLTQDASANEERYAGTIRAAERDYYIPDGLLARLLYQESHFRTDIINGQVRSKTGAVGIAQFMPATAADLGINPLEPHQAIRAAAKYLRQLYNNFGTWSLALMAYNWGWGNVSAWQKTGLGAKGQPMPPETVAYVSEITDDVGLA